VHLQVGLVLVVEAKGTVAPCALEHSLSHVNHHVVASEGLLQADQIATFEDVSTVIMGAPLWDH